MFNSFAYLFLRCVPHHLRQSIDRSEYTCTFRLEREKWKECEYKKRVPKKGKQGKKEYSLRFHSELSCHVWLEMITSNEKKKQQEEFNFCNLPLFIKTGNYYNNNNLRVVSNTSNNRFISKTSGPHFTLITFKLSTQIYNTRH